MFQSAPITTLNYEKQKQKNKTKTITLHEIKKNNVMQRNKRENCTSSLSQKHNTSSSTAPQTLVLIIFVFLGQ